MDKKRNINRYSDSDLRAFRALIDQKIEATRGQLEQLQSQLDEISASNADDHGGDWVEDSNRNAEMELLNQMTNRQRKYLQDLLQALRRIENKSYGICSITGELIDRRRLMAVPTTTKSLAAKSALYKQATNKRAIRLTDQPYVQKKTSTTPKRRKIISRIVSKANSNKDAVQPEKEIVDLSIDEDFLSGDAIDFGDLVIEEED